jgi:hypothetical protein
MKRIVAIILAAIMVLVLVSCGNSGNKGNTDTTNKGTTTTTNSTGDKDTTKTTETSENPSGAKLTASLNVINLDDRDSSILRGVTIKGNCAGTADYNSRESSLTDVRCIFEINEWIDFYPDTDAQYYLRVWVLKHRDDQEYYNKCKFSDLMPNFASYCDLHYPVDEENPDEHSWGSFYLNKDDCETGYYDFVFTYEGKAIAVLQTRFYGENELTTKSDAELEALMHE